MKINYQLFDIFLVAEKSTKDQNSERRKIPNQLPTAPNSRLSLVMLLTKSLMF